MMATQDKLVKRNGFTTLLGDKLLCPVDQTGVDSLDILHQLFKHVLEGKQHTDAVKFGRESHVLDLGCGSGLWVMFMALNPKLSSIIAAYNHLVLPRNIPQTVTFTTVDIEGEWTHMILQHAPYDLVNCRLMRGSIKSWPTLYGKIATHLKPETGVFEQFEIDWKFERDDGLIPGGLQQWSDSLHQAMEYHGMSIRCDPEETRSMLLGNGFDNVQERAIRLPVNDWQSDDVDKIIGKWFNLALTNSILPMSTPPLVRAGNNKVKAINDLIAKVSEELHSEKDTQGLYCMLYIWTARVRPLERQQTHTSDDTATPYRNGN